MIKILVIRLSSLGDVLLTTPVIRALKQKYPSPVIHYLIKPNFTDAVSFNTNIEKIHTYSAESIESLLNDLGKEDFDLIIDLQNNFRSREIGRRLKIDTMRFKKPSLKKFLLVNFKINLYSEIKSIPEMYSDAIEGLTLDSDGLELSLPETQISKLNPDIKYIGFCPGSQHFTKRWPEEYFIELGNLLNENNFAVVLFGGKSDETICSEISAELTNAINLQNNNDLLQTAADMRLCKTIVTNDSGMMHTASSVGVPLLAIFGSSVREFGFSPYKVPNLILENKSLSCRPCSHIGKDSCPKGHFNCMNEITPQHVFNKLQEFLKYL